jgi:hypothetical protein
MTIYVLRAPVLTGIGFEYVLDVVKGTNGSKGKKLATCPLPVDARQFKSEREATEWVDRQNEPTRKALKRFSVEPYVPGTSFEGGLVTTLPRVR